MPEKWCRILIILKFTRIRLTRERGGVSKIFMLAIFLGIVAGMLSLNRETTEGPLRYLKSLDVTYWVHQPGADSTSSNSYVNTGMLNNLRAHGYQADGTLVYFSEINSIQCIYTSYTPGGILDPKLSAGRQVSNDHETVLDHTLAQRLHVHIGDKVRLVNDTYTVVGLSTHSNSIGKQPAFINQAAMAHIVGSVTYQFLAVRVRPGQAWPPSAVSFKSYSVVTQQQFLKSNLAVQTQTITPFFVIIIAIAIAGLAVMMGISLKREYDQRVPVLARWRAVGALRSQLISVEMLVMFIVSLLGVVVAAFIARAVAWVANSAIPGVTASIAFDDLAFAFVAAMVISLLALALPMWRLYRLSPMEAMRRE